MTGVVKFTGRLVFGLMFLGSMQAGHKYLTNPDTKSFLDAIALGEHQGAILVLVAVGVSGKLAFSDYDKVLGSVTSDIVPGSQVSIKGIESASYRVLNVSKNGYEVQSNSTGKKLSVGKDDVQKNQFRID